MNIHWIIRIFDELFEYSTSCSKTIEFIFIDSVWKSLIKLTMKIVQHVYWVFSDWIHMNFHIFIRNIHTISFFWGIYTCSLIFIVYICWINITRTTLYQFRVFLFRSSYQYEIIRKLKSLKYMKFCLTLKINLKRSNEKIFNICWVFMLEYMIAHEITLDLFNGMNDDQATYIHML